MDYVEKIKRLQHDTCYYDINVYPKESTINIDIYRAPTNEFVISMLVNEKDAKKAYDAMRHFNFIECRVIKKLDELLEFTEDNDLTVTSREGQIQFVKYYLDGNRKKFSKSEVEKMHNVKIDVKE